MNNREKIIQQALELFSSRGYDAVGVQEIVTAAGITKPTLYHYFGSKYGLLEAILETYARPFIWEVKQAADYQGDITCSITRLARTYFEFAAAQPVYYRFQLALWFSPPESEAHKAISLINDEQQHLLEEMFVKAVQNHGNMWGRHTLYAASLLGILNTYAVIYLNNRVEFTDELVYRVVHQYMHGIFS